MKSMRTKILGFLTAVIMTFALPVGAAGPAKQFSLAFNPGALVAGNNPNVMVRIKNESPNGNSSTNSIDIVLPAGHTVYAAPQFNPAYAGNIDWSTSGRVKISNMTPIKRGESVFLNIPVNVASTATCSSSGWNSTVAWTGSSFSGDTFDKIAPTNLPAGYVASTTPSGSLSLSFGPYPTSFVVGSATPYNLSVSVASTCGTPPPTQVTLAATTSVAGVGTQTTAGGQTTFALTFNALGPVTLTASAPNTTSIAFSSTVFPFGSLACGDDLPAAATNTPPSRPATEPGYAFGKRGLFNAKGSTCELVNYAFINQILTPGQNIVNVWDTTLQPDAAFYYSVNWQAKTLVTADLGYPPATRPKVAWASFPPIDGLACLSNKLPRPYGRLPALGLSAISASVTLDTTSPPTGGWAALPAAAVPFPINVGSERMTATVTSGTTLSLARGQAFTTASSHAAGSYAMSTPMPVDPRSSTDSPYSGEAVQMCIVSHGWQAYTPDPVTGDTRYFWVTDAIDAGDGFMSLD